MENLIDETQLVLYNFIYQYKEDIMSKYTGFIAHNFHYGMLLIGEEIFANHYEFYLPPAAFNDVDYHMDIKRFSVDELRLEGVLDLTEDDGEFVDDVEILEFIGMEYKAESKFYVGSPTGVKRKKTYDNNWSTMETVDMLRVNQIDAMYHGYGLDNAIFARFKKGIAFDEVHYFNVLNKVVQKRMYPDFIVVPDIIGGGLESLSYSVTFVEKLKEYDFPKYLVVQDGMKIEDVEPYLNRLNNKEGIEFDGIFVGGKPTFNGFGKKKSTEVEWKLKTMEAWSQLAKKHNKKCHVGRVSSLRRFNFARSLDFDSYDTSIMNFKPVMFEQYKKSQQQQVMQFCA